MAAYVCDGQAAPGRQGILASTDLRILVREADLAPVPGYTTAYVPNRVIASFRIEDPRACDPFCTLQLDQNRAVWIEFRFTGGSTYTGPRRSEPARLPPPETVPVAKPSGTAATSPQQPPSTSSNSLSSTTTTSTGSGSMAPIRSADGIDQRLALRDLNNCSGADAFYPQASGQTAQARQAYQMAAFSLAISDPATKQAVLNAVQARVGDDAFFTAITDVIANPLQSEMLVTAYQNTAKNLSQQISSSGLTSLMASPVPPSALPSYVEQWLAKKLSTPALVSSAVNLMASSSLTAECTINELAKQGFTDMVLAR